MCAGEEMGKGETGMVCHCSCLPADKRYTFRSIQSYTVSDNLVSKEVLLDLAAKRLLHVNCRNICPSCGVCAAVDGRPMMTGLTTQSVLSKWLAAVTVQHSSGAKGNTKDAVEPTLYMSIRLLRSKVQNLRQPVAILPDRARCRTRAISTLRCGAVSTHKLRN